MPKQEIKFKVWDKKEKKWRNDVWIRPDGILVCDDMRIDGTENGEEVDIVFFTGKKDKNGKEIIKQQKKIEDWGEKEARELSLCIDIMPKSLKEVQEKAYNVALDMAYISRQQFEMPKEIRNFDKFHHSQEGYTNKVDIEEVKSFIRQEKQKSYQQGFIDGGEATAIQSSEIKIAEIKEIIEKEKKKWLKEKRDDTIDGLLMANEGLQIQVKALLKEK